jgi:hypothetical protein
MLVSVAGSLMICSCVLTVVSVCTLFAKVLPVAETLSAPCDEMWIKCSISARVLFAEVLCITQQKGIPCRTLTGEGSPELTQGQKELGGIVGSSGSGHTHWDQEQLF